MEYFVDELPKDCIECPFCQDIKVNAGMDRLLFCKANKGKVIKNIKKSFDKCIVKNEFQSLVDYTKQVREEVVEEIRQLCEKEKDENDLAWLGFKKLNRILDQVKGENNARI